MAGPKPLWVDSHCHLFAAEGNTDEVLRRAHDAGVAWVMCPGIDLETSLQARRLSLEHRDMVMWAAGLHPHDAVRWSDEEARLTALIAEADAIGECGLDYYRDLSPRPLQREVFRRQLQLAGDLDKPIIVHCRDAFADVYEDVAAADLGERVVLHSWTGGPKWTKRFDALGVTFSFAGMVTYPTAETVRLAVAVAPPQRSMVETDTPYLSPQPHRSSANEPAFVPITGAQVAEIWDLDLAETARLTAATAQRVFRFGGV
ncbi:MAG: TatD family hydrolase [bacterium]|nr:TatD family hydrolase [bacterium]MCP4968563.1 TatD family hydrolase [bacterium]